MPTKRNAPLRFGCVIMASGLGKRFGGNKLLADFHGQPMISRILEATDGLFEHRVVVTRHEAVAALCRERQIAVILHSYPQRSDTVRIGLQAIGDADGCMFCPGDQPLLTRNTVSALLQAAQSDPSAIWRTAFGDTPGSPVLFPAWCFPELLSLPDGKGGGHVIHAHTERIQMLQVKNAYELMDADTPEDLRILLEQ